MWLGFGDAIKHWARYKPNKIALTVGERIFSFNTLYKRAVDIGNFISKSNIRGRIAVSVKNKFDFIAAVGGVNLVGNPIIILPPFTDSEALEIHLLDTKPSAIIGDRDFLGSIPSNDTEGIHKLDIVKIPKSSEEVTERDTCEEWGILFSSGSTGVPKAIVYNNLSMTSELLAWCLELGITRETRFYIGRPVYYTGGLVLALTTLLVGGDVIFSDHNIDENFEEIWKHYQICVKKNNIQYAFFIPDQIRIFLKIASNPAGGPTILVMGAPITAGEKRRVTEILNSPVIESWGNSEGLGTITDKDDLYNRPESIGRPFLTEEIYVISDDLEKCKPQEIGRLAGSEETMFVEYANRPEATKEVKKDNLILSDDIGYMDGDGYFYILGRAQEAFVVNGKTIIINEMEEKIRNLRDVKDVCIVVKEEEGRAYFFVEVVSNNAENNDLIREEIKKKLNVEIAGILFTDTLPRLISGKLDRIKAKKLIPT